MYHDELAKFRTPVHEDSTIRVHPVIPGCSNRKSIFKIKGANGTIIQKISPI